MSRLAKLTRTSTGVLIGLAHIPAPRRELGVEAERIQTALLRRPNNARLRSIALAIAVGVAVAVLLVAWVEGGV